MALKPVTLLENTTGVSSDYTWPGGPCSFTAEGTFGEVALQLKTDQGTYFDVSVLTENGTTRVDLPNGTIRLNARNGASSIYASVVRS